MTTKPITFALRYPNIKNRCTTCHKTRSDCEKECGMYKLGFMSNQSKFEIFIQLNSCINHSALFYIFKWLCKHKVEANNEYQEEINEWKKAKEKAKAAIEEEKKQKKRNKKT
jgi:hypothetical protein